VRRHCRDPRTPRSAARGGTPVTRTCDGSMLSACAVREVAMGFFTMKSHSAAFAWAMAALALSCDATAGDFIFGEDFEGVPSCTGGTGFSIGGTPPAHTRSHWPRDRDL